MFNQTIDENIIYILKTFNTFTYRVILNINLYNTPSVVKNIRYIYTCTYIHTHFLYIMHLPKLSILRYQSSFMSALLHTYFPPLFRNIFSSNPLNFIAASTPISKIDLEGSFRPFLQFRKRMYSSRMRYESLIF